MCWRREGLEGDRGWKASATGPVCGPAGRGWKASAAGPVCGPGQAEAGKPRLRSGLRAGRPRLESLGYGPVCGPGQAEAGKPRLRSGLRAGRPRLESLGYGVGFAGRGRPRLESLGYGSGLRARARRGWKASVTGPVCGPGQAEAGKPRLRAGLRARAGRGWKASATGPVCGPGQAEAGKPRLRVRFAGQGRPRLESLGYGSGLRAGRASTTSGARDGSRSNGLPSCVTVEA
jgi:hypothetical protein